MHTCRLRSTWSNPYHFIIKKNEKKNDFAKKKMMFQRFTNNDLSRFLIDFSAVFVVNHSHRDLNSLSLSTESTYLFGAQSRESASELRRAYVWEASVSRWRVPFLKGEIWGILLHSMQHVNHEGAVTVPKKEDLLLLVLAGDQLEVLLYTAHASRNVSKLQDPIVSRTHVSLLLRWPRLVFCSSLTTFTATLVSGSRISGNDVTALWFSLFITMRKFMVYCTDRINESYRLLHNSRVGDGGRGSSRSAWLERPLIWLRKLKLGRCHAMRSWVFVFFRFFPWGEGRWSESDQYQEGYVFCSCVSFVSSPGTRRHPAVNCPPCWSGGRC